MTMPPSRSMSLAVPMIMLLLVGPAALPADEELPQYESTRSIAGTLSIWGPAHMSAIAELWTVGFGRVQPGMTLQFKLLGSDTAIPGLYSGQADIALLGRENNITDDNGFSRPMGYMPQRFQLMTGSLDVPGKTTALVVFVHRDNPLNGLTITQLDAIFGHEHRRSSTNIRTWGQLGLDGEWADEPIRLFGYDISTGTGRYFSTAVLDKSRKLNWENLQEFRDVRRVDGSVYRAAEQTIDALQRERYGMAVSCLCFENPQVKDLALAKSAGSPYVRATRETLTSRAYPLTRITYAFIDRPPGSPVDPKVREFLRYIFSRDGQADIYREGDYLPLPARVAREQHEQL